MTAKKIKEKLVKISAEIGMAEILRHSGQYYPSNDILKLRNQFARYQRLYRKARLRPE